MDRAEASDEDRIRGFSCGGYAVSGSIGQKEWISKGKKEIGVRDMTFAGLTNNKKRTVMTIVTMGLSCVLFVSMANFAGNMDAQYDARKQVAHGQFQIELDYSLNDTAYPENNLDSVLKENPLKGELADEIREIGGRDFRHVTAETGSLFTSGGCAPAFR